jgi:ribose-phosphate pyrophosphokinase
MEFQLFSGRSHPKLSKEIADELRVSLGPLALTTFPDGEISLQIQESVRGKEVFVIQSLGLDPHTSLFELLILIDALKRASAKSIGLVLPYFAYARQDRKDHPRKPITAKLIADLLTKAGACRVLTLDLHAEQIEGFFDIPVDHLTAVPLLAAEIKKWGLVDPLVVAPDLGAVKRAHAFARHLEGAFAVIDKKRIDPHSVKVEGMVGASFEGRDVLLVDDLCSTGQTLAAAASACKSQGARRIFAAFTHGLLTEMSHKVISEAPIERIFLTDSVPFKASLDSKFIFVKSAPLFAEALKRLESAASLSHLTQSLS